MNIQHRSSVIAALAIAGAALIGCSEADSTANDSTTTSAAPASTVSETTGNAGDDRTDLAAAGCPSPFVIQTDWFPEAEYGALYGLIGDGYTIDKEQMRVSGPLTTTGGVATGIDIEIRSGGPVVGNSTPRVVMATDPSIHLGHSNTDGQAAAWDKIPMVSVLAPLEINPQMIMWDPDEHPDVHTLADVGTKGLVINVFSADGYTDYFVGKGIWSAEQLDPSYDGSPARFVADPTIAQQGFASSEPYKYEFLIEQYGKQPKFALLHDAGFEIYSQTLAARPDDLDRLRPCLQKLIPIVQQSAVDFAKAPERANKIIVEAVETYDSFWVYGPGNAEYGVKTMTELGLHGNGPDSTVGNFDETRVQRFLDEARSAGMKVPDGLRAADMFTNEFIDTSIGF